MVLKTVHQGLRLFIIASQISEYSIKNTLHLFELQSVPGGRQCGLCTLSNIQTFEAALNYACT